MRKWNFRNVFEIRCSLSFRRVKILQIPLPNNADDVYYNMDNENITYWIGAKMTTIELQPHKEGVELLHCTDVSKKSISSKVQHQSLYSN